MKNILYALTISWAAFCANEAICQVPQALPFSQNWTNIALISSDDNWSGHPGIRGYRGDDITTVTGTDPQTLLVDGTTTPLDVNANQTNPNTFATGGLAEFEIANPVVALNGSGTADAPFLLISLNTTGFNSITVTYNVRDLDGSIDNSIQQVALHYRIGNTGNFTNLPLGYIPDATTGPSLAILVTPISVTLPADANNLPEVQIRVMTTNAVGNDEWVGVDDISVTGTPVGTCSIDNITAANFSACNDNSSSSTADDFFTADVTVNFTNPPASGTLDLSGDGTASVAVGSLGSPTSHTFTGVVFSADGLSMIVNASFSANSSCNLTGVNVGTAPAPCSSAPACSVSNIVAGSYTACNDNGTPFGSDDFFTASVTVTFANPPATGTLNLSGDGTASVAVDLLDSPTSHTFTGVMFSADGGSIDLTAAFSAPPACMKSMSAGSALPACSCGLLVNEVDYDQVGTDNAEFIELYNPCASAINIDNYSLELVNGSGGGAAIYTTVNLPNASVASGGYYLICGLGSSTANCNLSFALASDNVQNGSPDAIGLRYLTTLLDALSYEGNTGAPYTEGTGVSVAGSDDNTTTAIGLSRFPNGSDTNNNSVDFSRRCITPGAANSSSSTGCTLPCNISGISVANISACDSKGTTDPADDTFTADVTVTFANPPATGNLNVTGDPIFSPITVAVGSLGSPTSHTFTGVVFSADGTAIMLNAFFSADAGCTFSVANAGTAPSACSGTVCTVSGISVGSISTCNDNGTPFGSDDFFTANVTVTFSNPPGGGNLTLTGDGFVTVAVGNLDSPTSHTFTNVMMSADGSNISLSATFSANSNCTFTNNNAGVAPTACSCALKINEVDYDQPSTDNAEFLELYNPCGTSQNLDNYSVELVNGSNGAVYQTIDLPNTNLATGDYFVICASSANTINCDLDVSPETDLIQNGAPDAVGLKYLTQLVDAVSYEGNTAGYTEGSGTGLTDNGGTAGVGISRFPNGSDTNQNNVDFSPRCITPGAANSSSNSGCVALCNISAITLGTPSACNSNGTSNPADDTFTANVTVTFANPPATGNLSLTGDPIFAPITVAVGSLGSPTSHTFPAVVFAADGTVVSLTAFFSAESTCTFTNSNAGTAPSACSCNISAVTASNISACNDQGTSNPADDRFTASVTVTFANPPASGNLLVTGDPIFSPITVAVGSLGSPTSHTFNNVLFSADGTAINLNAFFSADATCTASNSNAGMAPAPCSPCEITSVSMANASGCNSNGTPNPADDFFTADVTVTYFSKPGGGNLVLSGGASASVPVGSTGANSHTFFGVQIPANGSTVSLTATFSANPTCTLTNPAAGFAPSSCSPCGITGIALSNVSACENQGTTDPADDFFTADVTVSYFQPPASGTLDLTGDGSASTSSFSGTSHTFFGVTFYPDGTPILLTASFSANSACSFTNNNAGTAPIPCSDFCFVIITNIDVEHESCPSAGDGSMVISATGTGQLAYSIDGGASFNLTGVFNFLTAGTYPVVVWVQGDPTCSDTETVTVNVVGAPQTWYKDLDGDLYSDGVTQVACAQPAGFQLAGNLISINGDCDDNDPNEFPNQTWYKDADNDDYSNGAVMIQCTRPFGFKTLAELTQPTGDCNDNNASIHPGAPELCNGLDDDCDGQVDEGAAGGLTFNGNVTFTTQAQVNAFSQCYSVINGNLTIQNAGISSLANLINLVQVTGNVTIKWTSLANMAGLDNLANIGGNLLIYSNSSTTLISLDGLEGLTSVGGNLKVFYNLNLSDCCAIEDLLNGGVGGTISIYQNDSGCDSVTEIIQDCNGGGSIILPPGGNGQATIFEEVQQMEIFPNPTSDRLNILLSSKLGDGELLLHDASGRLFWRQATNEQMSEYGFEKSELNLLPGLYLLEWRGEGGRIWRRVAVQ